MKQGGSMQGRIDKTCRCLSKIVVCFATRCYKRGVSVCVKVCPPKHKFSGAFANRASRFVLSKHRPNDRPIDIIHSLPKLCHTTVLVHIQPGVHLPPTYVAIDRMTVLVLFHRSVDITLELSQMLT
jgi:hypothetical protein